jgi:recombination protein RecA
MQRVSLGSEEKESPRKAAPDFYVSSGSTLLDLVLGGGWPRGRIMNIVGDRSVGKTGLAIEACANFARVGSSKCCRYGEAESAFDDAYAEMLGMPKGITRPTDPLETVEQFHDDLDAFLKKGIKVKPLFYVLDSLDALSDAAEMDRGMEEATYGQDKAKQLSKLFRKLTSRLEHEDCSLFVISQVRDNIGVKFGPKTKRSGGKALDFYASQILWLSQLRQLKRTVRGVERTYGIEVRVRATKNKVGLPFREADIQLIFNYGIDDEMSMIEYLKKYKAWTGADKLESVQRAIVKAREAQDREHVDHLRELLAEDVISHWMGIEAQIEPPMRKYA